MEGLVQCPGCGARVKDLPGVPHKYIGANAGCWEVYGEILAKEYGEYRYPELTHRLTSDTYAVQHPGTPERRSIQSVTGHLVSLCLVLEHGLTGRQATDALGRVIKHAADFTWLTPPAPNGTVTVLDVVKAKDLPEHERLVRGWAEDVWKAWRGHHARIRALVDRHGV